MIAKENINKIIRSATNIRILPRNKKNIYGWTIAKENINKITRPATNIRILPRNKKNTYGWGKKRNINKGNN